MICKRAILCLIFITSSSGFANNYPKQAAVPGGIVKLNLGHHKQTPVVRFQKQRVMVLKNGNQWQAVIGIPLDSAPGQASIEVSDGKNNLQKISFTIQDKQYKKQYITVKKKRHVTPSKKDLIRINKEKKIILGHLGQWSEQNIFEHGFKLPVKGRLTSPFGLRRFFNKQPRSPHKGIDIAARAGTLMRSPAPGRVLGRGKYFFNGNTVFIDHGQSLVTMYCHMQKIKVKPGQRLKQGGIIGTVGKTGRVTGPHVHWGVFLNKTAVDPFLFLPRDAFMLKKSAK